MKKQTLTKRMLNFKKDSSIQLVYKHLFDNRYEKYTDDIRKILKIRKVKEINYYKKLFNISEIEYLIIINNYNVLKSLTSDDDDDVDDLPF